jgi:predicted permease
MSDRWGRALFGLLLRLYPPGARRGGGPRMERLLDDMLGDCEASGRAAGTAFWLTVAWDTARGAALEWIDVMRTGGRPRAATTRGEPMSALWSDVRFAVRQILRQPTYAITIVLLMSVGVAGNAAVFRVVNGLFLRPLPFEHPDRLVDLDETAPQWDLEFLSIAYRDFDRWRAEASTFHSMAVFDQGGGNALIEGAAVRLSYLLVTHDIDEVLGIEAELGRFYGPEEDRPDGERVALLTRAAWEQHFGADPAVLGSTLSLNGFPVEIIGVLPPEAAFLADVELWLPLRADPAEFNGWGLNAIGRLADGVTIEQARADLLAVHKAMIPEFEVNEISSPVVHSLRDRYLGDYRVGSGFLMGSVAIVLLLACANIGALMFARSLARRGELGLRSALGAPRTRIVRQLLTESFVLAAIGGLGGLLLGVWGSGAVTGPLADQFPRWVSFELDARFMAFVVGITMAAAALFGLLPALQASRTDRLAGARTTASVGRSRALGLLVAGEVALAMALLVVGGLSLLDVQRLARVDPGFRAEGLVSYALSLPTQRYEDGPARLAFAQRYIEELERRPEIRSAAIGSALPLGGHWGWFFLVEGAPPRAEDEANPVVLNRIVSPGYFETVGVQLAAGRGFDDFDGREDGSRVIVVNETFVRTHLSHLPDPIGARLASGTELGDDPDWMTVVGVARDVKHYGVDQEMRPGVYQPLRQLPLQGFQVALRVDADAAPGLAAARAVTADVDPELPMFSVQRMTERLDQALLTRRAMSWLIAAFSTVALILAVAGIYGVIAYTVGQRTREIGIRLAMGASSEDVLGAVLRQGMTRVVVGAGLGLVAALAGAGVVSRILVGVDATEPRVYVAVTLLLVSVAALASYLPARRVSGLDPATVLRRE